MEFDSASSTIDSLGLELIIHSWKPHTHISELRLGLSSLGRLGWKGQDRRVKKNCYRVSTCFKVSLHWDSNTLLKLSTLSQPSLQYYNKLWPYCSRSTSGPLIWGSAKPQEAPAHPQLHLYRNPHLPVWKYPLVCRQSCRNLQWPEIIFPCVSLIKHIKTT